MRPLRRHQIEGPDVVQFSGLLILIDLIYKHFAPGMHAHVTLSTITAFVAGLFLLIWPMSVKARQ
jgi:hypothetical protein